jgi:hypothetical protein
MDRPCLTRILYTTLGDSGCIVRRFLQGPLGSRDGDACPLLYSGSLPKVQ